jgi:hypothetical protein
VTDDETEVDEQDESGSKEPDLEEFRDELDELISEYRAGGVDPAAIQDILWSRIGKVDRESRNKSETRYRVK